VAKSNTRTVLAATLDAVSSYSSGPLDVGDLNELLVTVGPTTISTSTDTVDLSVKAIDAFGNLWPISGIRVYHSTPGSTQGMSIGAGLSNTGTSQSGQSSFGDQIQVDLSIQPGDTVTTQLSIKGK
jgi:hypothetical protein